MWWMTRNTSTVSVTFSTPLTNEFVAQIALIGISVQKYRLPDRRIEEHGELIRETFLTASRHCGDVESEETKI